MIFNIIIIKEHGRDQQNQSVFLCKYRDSIWVLENILHI